jgi:hypothetical protein
MRNRLLGHPRGPRPPLTEMVVQIPPAGPSPAGAFRAATDIARTEAYSALTSDHRHDPRTEELINLRVALATFALQLDAFEMRTRGSLRGVKSEIPAMATQVAGSRRKK